MDLPLIEVHRVGALQKQYCFYMRTRRSRFELRQGIHTLADFTKSDVPHHTILHRPTSSVAISISCSDSIWPLRALKTRRGISQDRPSLHSKGSGAPARTNGGTLVSQYVAKPFWNMERRAVRRVICARDLNLRTPIQRTFRREWGLSNSLSKLI